MLHFMSATTIAKGQIALGALNIKHVNVWKLKTKKADRKWLEVRT